jgi:YidC/Oxa1 family membrane protein insertase
MTQQEDLDMERRLLLAIAVSMAVLLMMPYVYRWWFPAGSLEEQGVQEEVVQEGAGPGDVQLVEERYGDRDGGQGTVDTEDAGGSLGEAMDVMTEEEPPAGEREVEISNGKVDFRFSSMGGTLLGCRILGYRDKEGQPLELLRQDGMGVPARTLGLDSDDPAWLAFNNLPFHVRVEEDLPEGFRVDFWRSHGGRKVVKTIRVPREQYDVFLRLEVTGVEVERWPWLVLGTRLGSLEDEQNSDFADQAVVWFANRERRRIRAKDVTEEQPRFLQDLRWIGLDSRYFAVIGLMEGGNGTGRIVKRVVDVAGDGAESEETFVSVGATSELRLFFGPKEEKTLARVDPTLSGLVDYGWLAILVRPLLACLRWFYGLVGNYGWSIIILTLLINLALVPLRYKQVVSMRKLSELQPKMRSIQDRYKKMKRDDPRRQNMNVEIMELYREHGVNPLGGCLPLLIQMPILFAFYRMLASSIELRGAPFILWIEDLSRPDPYYVTPILMGIAMVFQQKVMPSTSTDPMQQKMMMVLPIIFTFLFLKVSSGLAVYFLFSNVFGILFQVALQAARPELAPAPVRGKGRRSGQN